AAAQGMAPRVDDLRVRQNRVNEPDVEAVVRHLVDENRRAALAMYARRRQIAFAERAQLRGFERLDGAEKRRFGVDLVASGKLARDLRNVRQLHGPLDQRVAR